MIRAHRKSPAWTAWLLGLAALAASAAGPLYLGRPVVDVLAELRDGGLEFIYSSDLLPQTLRVLSEPQATSRMLIAREILEPHSLALAAVRPGLFAVVPMNQAGKSGTVSGQIADAHSGRAITGARIELLPVGAVEWSDGDGRFAIGPVPQGDYELRVQAAGYNPARSAAVTVTAAGASAELRLEPVMAELSNVVVSTSRYAFEDSGTFGSVQIDGDTIAAQPTLGDDTIRALARLPGIAQSGLSARSSIRGGETGEVLTLLDGFPLRQVFHLPGYQAVFGVVDAGLIDDAEVYTGGFPVRYGNRMAGVFDLRTVDGASEPRTALGLSTLNAMARRGGRIGPWNGDWLAAARVGTLQPLLQAFASDAGDPTYADAYARAGAGDADRVRVTANMLWSRDELGIAPEDSGERGQIESRVRYLWLRGDRDWNDDVGSSIWMGQSRVESFRAGAFDKPGIGTGTVADRRESRFFEARAHVDWQVTDRHWFEGGAEWVREDAIYHYDAQAQYTPEAANLYGHDPSLLRQIDLEPHRERIAVFAAHRWQVTEDLVSEVGLRSQHTITAGTTTTHWLHDPRINLLWQLAPATSLRAHWGRFHQTDEVHELMVEDGLTAFPEAQQSDHIILGLDHRFANGIALRVEGFRKLQPEPRPRFENSLDALSVIPELAVDRVQLAPTAADVRGVELSLISEGFVSTRWIALAWSRAEDDFGRVRTPRGWDQTWAATVGIDWTYGPWRFGAIGSAHRGWPSTRVDANGLGERNGIRLPTYGVLDLRAEYRRPLAIGNLALSFELTNALARHNVCCSMLKAVDDGSGGLTFTTQRRTWLPLVPAVGVLWEF